MTSVTCFGPGRMISGLFENYSNRYANMDRIYVNTNNLNYFNEIQSSTKK